jgi:hypothetical protein
MYALRVKTSAAFRLLVAERPTFDIWSVAKRDDALCRGIVDERRDTQPRRRIEQALSG